MNTHPFVQHHSMKPDAPEPRRISPAGDDPAALHVEISPADISADVAIIGIDDPKYGDERERPVKIATGNSSRSVGA